MQRMLDDISRAALKVPESGTPLAARLLSLLRRRRLQAARRALRRRAQSLRTGAHSRLAFELPAPRRAHQPPRHARQGRAARSHSPPSPARWSSSPTTATSSTASPPASSKSRTAPSPAYEGNYEDYLRRKEALAAESGAAIRRQLQKRLSFQSHARIVSDRACTHGQSRTGRPLSTAAEHHRH